MPTRRGLNMPFSQEHPSSPQSLSVETECGQSGCRAALSDENAPSSSAFIPARVEVCLVNTGGRIAAAAYIVVEIQGVRFKNRISGAWFLDQTPQEDAR